jgi:hypothetical protein
MSRVYSGPMLLGEDLMQIPLAVSFPNTLE